MQPRNYVVLAMIKLNKKTKVHSKSNKAKRRLQKLKLIKEYLDL